MEFNYEELCGLRIMECDYCSGTGEVLCDCTEGMGARWAGASCTECGGTGIVQCNSCGGAGVVFVRKEDLEFKEE